MSRTHLAPFVLCLGVMLGLAAVGGCSGDIDEPSISAETMQHVDVRGIVRVNGQPTPRLIVSFLPEEIGLNPVSAETDEEGRYSLKDKSGREIFPGPYRVIVSARPAVSPNASKSNAASKSSEPPAAVEPASPKSLVPPQQLIVKPGQPLVHDIEIRDGSLQASRK